ncbi:MAG TPA: COX15/CtaA family protein [Solirubrobacteraceae bacterium]|nr:COX15/CtaA family protein [Solirubrobacteraceae bacterium]
MPTFTPRRVEQLTLFALVTLGLIVLTGAAVRLSGSGLGCPNWPKCGQGVVAPLETHAWIEYGNRLASALVGLVSFAAGFAAWRRRPFRRDLAILGALLPVGVLMQGILGGLTVLFELKPGFVMGHFLLSMLILCAAVALYWRARREPDQLADPSHDARLVKATRALVPVGALALLAGTVATAAGPHAGENEENDPVSRLDTFGTLDTVIHWHGRTGTLLGLSAVAVWFLARRWGGNAELRRALTALCLLVAAQGVIGFAQYELELPAEIVWLHILVATGAWLALLFAVAAAGRLRPAPRPAPTRTDVEVERPPSPVLGSAGPHMR